MRTCSCKGCENPTSGGLQCGESSCARNRKGVNQSAPLSTSGNSASVGGVRQVEGSVEIVLPWDVLCSVNERQNPQSGFSLTRKYRAARKRQHEMAREQYTGPMLTGPVAIRFDFYPPSRRPDMGNYTKAVKDSLQGVAYKDDGQTRDERLRWMYIDKESPRVVVTVEAVHEAAA